MSLHISSLFYVTHYIKTIQYSKQMHYKNKGNKKTEDLGDTVLTGNSNKEYLLSGFKYETFVLAGLIWNNTLFLIWKWTSKLTFTIVNLQTLFLYFLVLADFFLLFSGCFFLNMYYIQINLVNQDLFVQV